MGVKLGKGEFPQGHGPDDFECFGPAAVADDQFDGTRICDMVLVGLLPVGKDRGDKSRLPVCPMLK
jgi:hypothetical protein